MSGFEFIFSLFGLLLGLALAEGLGGLARALKSRHKVRIGWPTALLGLFVTCDVVTFWMYGWGMRDLLPVNWPTLFGGFGGYDREIAISYQRRRVDRGVCIRLGFAGVFH